MGNVTSAFIEQLTLSNEARKSSGEHGCQKSVYGVKVVNNLLGKKSSSVPSTVLPRIFLFAFCTPSPGRQASSPPVQNTACRLTSLWQFSLPTMTHCLSYFAPLKVSNAALVVLQSHLQHFYGCILFISSNALLDHLLKASKIWLSYCSLFIKYLPRLPSRIFLLSVCAFSLYLLLLCSCASVLC